MAAPTAFSLVRTPVANVPRHVTVSAVEDLTPTYRRIRLAGDFADFESLGADDHLRIFFVPADFTGEDVASMREHPSREYTPVSWTDDSLVLDFVIHAATGGPAMDWAQNAVPGAVAMIGGPRGSLVIEGRPEWWLLAGDRTALPAIRRHLGQVAPGVPVDVVALAEDPADEQELASPGDLTVSWVRSLDALVATLARTPERTGEGFAFIAAEQSIVKPGRQHLQDRGIDLDHAVVKGYWKGGEAEYHAPH
ncbi:MAG TPA: siderophore-interacting protein [Microbacteriaceae bacterium]|nr:siderophore-interacting protein [Microbacteriaceae bacterium]